MLFLPVAAWAGGCEAQTLAKGEFLSQSCKLYRISKENNQRWLERLSRDRKVLSRELVDCSKAVREDDGWYYWPKTMKDTRMWCPNYDPAILKKQAEARTK